VGVGVVGVGVVGVGTQFAGGLQNSIAVLRLEIDMSIFPAQQFTTISHGIEAIAVHFASTQNMCF
jgi:hypothetical protein